MQRIPVISSTLSSVAYDATTRILELQFTSGDVYQYRQVPRYRYTELLNAPSKGTYFNLYIKDRYPFRKRN